VTAAYAAVEGGEEQESENFRVLLDQIRPAVKRAVERGGSCAFPALIDRVGRENVRLAVNEIRNSSGIIRRLVEHDGLLVVGAEYSLATGAVAFFDQDPD
jgi:carbonic anhydrase